MNKGKNIITILSVLLLLSVTVNIVLLFGGTKLTENNNGLTGYWVYGKNVIQINRDNSFIWVDFSDKKDDGKYIVHYRTGIVDDNTLLFDKVYKSDFKNLYYTPEQIPAEAFKNSNSSYVMNMMTNNVFVLSIGDHMTQYSFTRQTDYTLKYSDSEAKTIEGGGLIQYEGKRPQDIEVNPN